MVAFPQGSNHFHFTYWFLSELGPEQEFPLMLTLPSGNEIISKGGQEIVSVLLLEK
jgi:hypothetical protein